MFEFVGLFVFFFVGNFLSPFCALYYSIFVRFLVGGQYKSFQAVFKSNGGVQYGEAGRFVRVGMCGTGRNSGTSGESQRYAAGSNLFPRLL